MFGVIEFGVIRFEVVAFKFDELEICKFGFSVRQNKYTVCRLFKTKKL